MTGEIAVLQRALDVVSEEQADLRREIDVFAEFRDAVSHTFPSGDGGSPSRPTVELVERYRETVMATSDREVVTDDALERSLEREISAGIADALLSPAPFSSRLKRKLLVQTSTAIDQRTLFHEDLEREADSLETAAAGLRDVTAEAVELPACTVQDTSLEVLLEAWEAYDELEQRCERLLAQRQRQLAHPSRRVSVYGDEHALCRYLYEELETTYPVLSAVASVCERIDAARGGAKPSRRPA